jgi:quinol monooxygenase YgiN
MPQEESIMAICIVFEGPKVTKEQYQQVLNEVSPGNQMPQGMLYHVAGTPETGGFRVVEVWDSQEDADRFFQEKLGAALQRASINVQPQVFPVHNIMKA